MFYDRLMVQDLRFPDEPVNVDEMLETIIRQGLNKAQVFNIDNVADYFFRRDIGRSEQWLLNDFPNIAPPFRTYFMEFVVSRQLRPDAVVKKVGVLFLATDDMKATEGMEGWSCLGYIFVESIIVGQPIICIGRIFYVVDKMGALLEVGKGRLGINFFGRSIYEQGHEAAIKVAAQVSYEELYPALLATSLLHCKNVKMLPNMPPPKLSKAYQKRHGRPLLKYYTLEIEPMKQVLRTEGKSEEVGLKKALHICRGHFKDYRERGLFGKKKGIFWWDSHVRGHLSEGAVVKDYAVKR